MSKLDAYSDDQAVLKVTRRECGNRKHGQSAACERCLYLDGSYSVQRDVIGALRDLDGQTVKEMCVAIYGTLTVLNQRSVYRAAKSLLEAGRLKVFRREPAEAVFGHQEAVFVLNGKAANDQR